MEDDLKLIWKPGPHHDSTMPGTMQCNLLFRETLNYIKRLEKRDGQQRLRNRVAPKPQDTADSHDLA